MIKSTFIVNIKNKTKSKSGNTPGYEIKISFWIFLGSSRALGLCCSVSSMHDYRPWTHGQLKEFLLEEVPHDWSLNIRIEDMPCFPPQTCVLELSFWSLRPWVLIYIKILSFLFLYYPSKNFKMIQLLIFFFPNTEK